MVCHRVSWTHNLHILSEDDDSAENERIPLPNPSFFDKNVSLSVAGWIHYMTSAGCYCGPRPLVPLGTVGSGYHGPGQYVSLLTPIANTHIMIYVGMSGWGQIEKKEKYLLGEIFQTKIAVFMLCNSIILSWGWVCSTGPQVFEQSAVNANLLPK